MFIFVITGEANDAIFFDSPGYFEKLKKAGVPEEQAKAQADLMREQTESQNAAIEKVLKARDEEYRKELATKGDIQEVRNELANTRHEILKWVIGMMIAQTTLIITAFGIGIAILK